MPDYTLCGGCLHSSIELPELRRVDGVVPSWSFRQEQGPAPDLELSFLGVDPIYGSVSATLHQHEHGFRIVVDDTGIFDISPDGRRIVGYPFATAWDDFVRAHLIGRILATALHLDGALTLHGSAVEVGGRALAFLAPKHHGKTTLALALTKSGANLLTDDTLPVDVTLEAPVAHPGVHTMRIDPDAAAALLGSRDRATTREGKELVDDLPDSWICHTSTVLEAIYLLVPVTFRDDGMVARRERLSTTNAVVSLVGHAKIGAMLGAWGGPALLDRAARLAGRVPVYQLMLAQDMDTLPTAVEIIGAWHGHPLRWDARKAEALGG